jgi:hypothetical protein
MRYANSFNLGRIDLDRHFAAIERGLDLDVEPRPAPPPAPVQDPRELDELDLVAELSLLSDQLDEERSASGTSEDADAPAEADDATRDDVAEQG